MHDGAEYVPPEMLAEWEQRDPLVVFGNRLIERDEAEPGDLDVIDAECRDTVDQVVAEVEAWPMPDPADLEDGVYA